MHISSHEAHSMLSAAPHLLCAAYISAWSVDHHIDIAQVSLRTFQCTFFDTSADFLVIQHLAQRCLNGSEFIIPVEPTRVHNCHVFYSL